MKTLQDLELKNKKILIRADLNVPLNEKQEVTDTYRIKSFIPTLEYIMTKGGLPIVISHLGKPKGQKVPTLSLSPVARELEKLSGYKVIFINDCIGEEAKQKVSNLHKNEVLLLENLRFYSGEESGDENFAQALASLADVYINDAFGTAHRAHASMFAVAKLFSERAPGFLMQKEIEYFDQALKHPKHPLCVILGGAKVSGKLPVIHNLADKADSLIIGGAMANTFLAAKGYSMGKSLVEEEMFSQVAEIEEKLKANNCKLFLPCDFIVTSDFNNEIDLQSVSIQDFPKDKMALDIGEKSTKNFSKAIQAAATIIWNGPMGVFEKPVFATGTKVICEEVARNKDAVSIIGGGDTAAAINQLATPEDFDFISTGGGASLELLEGKYLPGIKALEI